jgi:3-oxoacyl-[acyl-carrier-protein] synthase II
MKDEIVISGCGMVTSLGNTVDETWNALVEGRSGITPIEEFDVAGFPVKSAARVHLPSAEDLGIHPRDSRIMGTHAYILMKCCIDAYEDAGLGQGNITPEQTGFFAGMGMVDSDPAIIMPSIAQSLNHEGEPDYDRFFGGIYERIYPLWLLSVLNNISFCQSAIRLGITGDNAVFSPGEDSAIHAFIEAYCSIADQKAIAALAGGVSEEASPFSIARRVCSSERTADRSNRIPGEGGAIMVLERGSDAEGRGTSPVAHITGYGASFGRDSGRAGPSSVAMGSSMKKALMRAGMTPSSIGVIIVSSAETLSGKGREAEAIHGVFEAASEFPELYSSEPALGNMLAGSPAVDIVLAERMLRYGIIPPVPEMKGYGNRSLPGHAKAVLINAFSDEGGCASIIVRDKG